MTDCLMSAWALFGMKSSSWLAWDGAKWEDTVLHNLKNLYGAVSVRIVVALSLCTDIGFPLQKKSR